MRLPVPRTVSTLLSLVCAATAVGCSTSPPVTSAAQAVTAAAPAVTGFAFAAAGDLGANRVTAGSLAALDRSSARFFLALGDLDYDQTPSDAAWCRYVRNRLPSKGQGFPFQVLVGNHEQDGGPDGRIANFAGCLPDRMRSSIGPGSRYGAEYAFSYPARNPLARFIMIAPNLKVSGERHTYGAGSPHRAWLVRQIRRARDAGVRWVIVGAHYPCLTTGVRHGCDSGEGIVELLLRKRVDLVLTGHNHMYERSKQLRLNSTDCTGISAGSYDADCVVDAGSDGAYRKGAGTVLVTSGSFGRTEPAENASDPESRYFAKVDPFSSGFVTYRVTRERVSARFVASRGDLDDSFSITAP